MAYEIKALVTGPNWAALIAVENCPATFARKTAALAWLIDYATNHNAKIIYEADPENPECFDVLVCWPFHAEQFTIEPVKN